jgi:hypothetical protein
VMILLKATTMATRPLQRCQSEFHGMTKGEFTKAVPCAVFFVFHETVPQNTKSA